GQRPEARAAERVHRQQVVSPRAGRLARLDARQVGGHGLDGCAQKLGLRLPVRVGLDPLRLTAIVAGQRRYALEPQARGEWRVDAVLRRDTDPGVGGLASLHLRRDGEAVPTDRAAPSPTTVADGALGAAFRALHVSIP